MYTYTSAREEEEEKKANSVQALLLRTVLLDAALDRARTLANSDAGRHDLLGGGA